MIVQLESNKKNDLVLEVIDGFTETDEKLCQKLFKEKLDQGSKKVNILIKIDEMKISNSSAKAFLEDTIYTLRNYKKIRRLAIVAHSNLLKAAVPIDNLFFERLSKGSKERYFDVSQLDEAYAFLHSKK